MVDTLLEIRNRVLALEANLGVTKNSVKASVDEAINQSYTGLHVDIPCYWAIQEATITPTNSGADLLLPTDCIHVLYAEDTSGSPINERTLVQQKEYARRLDNKGINTMALFGFDVASSKPKLRLSPAMATGDIVVTYTVEPAALVADGDKHIGNNYLTTYLVWNSRVLRLTGDNERISQIREAQGRAAIAKGHIKKICERFLGGLSSKMVISR